MPTVTIPVVGTVERKWLFVGAAAVAAFVTYAYWRRGRSASQVGYDPATGTVDLGTGGYQNPAPHAPDSGTVDEPGVISSNAEWGPRAVAALTEAGWASQFAASTVGKYLGGQALSPQEVEAIRAAFALVGDPPNPLAVVMIPGTSGPPPANQPPAATAPPYPSNLQIAGVGYYEIKLRWNASAGADHYEIRATGKHTTPTFKAKGTSVSVYPLQRRTPYQFQVWAIGPTGLRSAPSAGASATTK